MEETCLSITLNSTHERGEVLHSVIRNHCTVKRIDVRDESILNDNDNYVDVMILVEKMSQLRRVRYDGGCCHG